VLALCEVALTSTLEIISVQIKMPTIFFIIEFCLNPNKYKSYQLHSSIYSLISIIMRKKFTLEDDTQTKKKLWKWKIFLTGGDEQQDATETKTIDRKKMA
jgi:hypothetical protein